MPIPSFPEQSFKFVTTEQKAKELEKAGQTVVRLAGQGQTYTHVNQPILPGERQTTHTGQLDEGEVYVQATPRQAPGPSHGSEV